MTEAQPILDRIEEILNRMLAVNADIAATGSFPDGVDAEIDRLAHEHAELRARIEALAVMDDDIESQ